MHDAKNETVFVMVSEVTVYRKTNYYNSNGMHCMIQTEALPFKVRVIYTLKATEFII